MLAERATAVVNCSSLPAWVAGNVYAPGAQVAHRGRAYACRSAPFSAWCGESEFAPGESPAARDAWSSLGACSIASSDLLGQISGRCPASGVGCCPTNYTKRLFSDATNVVHITTPNQCALLRGGDDVIAANGGPQVVQGGSGRDTISAASGNNIVIGGRDTDTIATGTGNDTAIIFDLCEIGSDGEVIDLGTGNDTVIAPVDRPQLEALGVSLANVDHVVVKPQSCRSECANVPTCSGRGTCVDGALPGQMSCECDEPYAGANCETTRVDPQVLWTQGQLAGAGAFGLALGNAASEVLTLTESSVVTLKNTGAVVRDTAVAPSYSLSSNGADFGRLVGETFARYLGDGTLDYQVVAPKAGHAHLLTDAAKHTYIPEIVEDLEHSSLSHARLFGESGQVSRFPIEGAQVTRARNQGLLYTTTSELVSVNWQGVVQWRVPVRLKTFEVAETGTTAVGHLDEPGVKLVHINTLNGSVGPTVALADALWNLSISPNGNFAIATTRTEVTIFQQGAVLRQATLPVRWISSAAISNNGDAIVGAKEPNHEIRLFVFGANGAGAAMMPGASETNGLRPDLRFFADGQRWLSNTTSGIKVYSLRP